MQTYLRRKELAALFALSLILGALAGCAARQVERSRQVSVNVHAVLAAVDDAEMALFKSGSVPAWTAEKHRDFSQHMATALRAGKALNESVRAVPVTGQARADLAIVSAELDVLIRLIEGVLPPDNAVRLRVLQAAQAVLQVLPIFLE